jgi:hypothetical protein
MEHLSSNLWIEVVGFLSIHDSFSLRALSKASKSKADLCFVVLSQSMPSEVDQLNASPLYAEFQDTLAARQAHREAWLGVLSGMITLRIREVRPMQRSQGPEMIEVIRLCAFIALRRKIKPVSWEESQQVLSEDDCLQRIGAVDDEYLCIPSVKKVLSAYFDSPDNALANITHPIAATLHKALESMTHFHKVEYEEARAAIQRRHDIYARIEHLQTQPLPPRPKGKTPAKGKASSSKKPLRR